MQPTHANLIRIVWSLVAIAMLALTITGLSPYHAELKRGTIGVRLEPNPAGNIVLFPSPGREAALVGVQEGDILLAVSGKALPSGISVDETIEAMRGLHGEQVDITVRQADGTEKSLTIVRSRQFLAHLAGAGISFGFYQAYLVTLSLLVALIFTVFSAWLIWQKRLEKVAALTSLTLLLIPYSLNLSGVASFGAEQFGIYWFYALIRTAGLLTIVVFLTIFPNGNIFPSWARWLLIGVGVWLLPFYISQINTELLPEFMIDWAWVLIFVLSIVALVMRFRSAATVSLEKDVIRKILLAGVIALGLYALLLLLDQFLPVSFYRSPPGIWFNLFSQLAWSAVAIYLGYQMALTSHAR